MTDSGYYPFPLCLQLPAMDPESEEFRGILRQLKTLGFYGVELNLRHFTREELAETRALVEEQGLRITMLATGAFAKAQGLSLSSPDEQLRLRSADFVRRQVLPLAAKAGCGAICGFLKGSPGQDPECSREPFARSVEELRPACEEAGVPFYLEATTRMDACVLFRLEEGMALTPPPKAEGGLFLLPDLYHMNIEESDLYGAHAAALPWYRNLHISDGNRFFPGFCRLDFISVFRLLRCLGYEGTVTTEARVRRSLREDLKASAAYLQGLTAVL